MKKLNKNTSLAANNMKAYASVSYCACDDGCPTGANDAGMRMNTIGAGRSVGL